MCPLSNDGAVLIFILKYSLGNILVGKFTILTGATIVYTHGKRNKKLKKLYKTSPSFLVHLC